MSETPSVGRIVHYVSHGTPLRPDGTQVFTSECRAAIVTAVQGQLVNPTNGENTDTWIADLTVINPTGLFFHEGCKQDELPPADKILVGERAEHKGGTWHWPERA